MRRIQAGGAVPWGCLGEDGYWYVSKFQNCPQEQRRQGPALQVLPADLICGRLGRLLHPPVCPEVAVVDVAAEIIGEHHHGRTRTLPATPITPGPSFGSRLVEGAVDTKADASRLSEVPPAAIARLAVFHAWLRGGDISYMITGDGQLLSIDHGYFLGDFRRMAAGEVDALPVTVKVPSALHLAQQRAAADFDLFVPALQALAAIPVEGIVGAFAGIPAEWGLSLDLRARLAAFVLERRDGVEQAVGAFCRRWRARGVRAATPHGPSAYQRVMELVTERPAWGPVLNACMELAADRHEFAGRWVRMRLGGTVPSLQPLIRAGILEKTHVTQGGSRAYYALRDGPAVRQALSDLGLLDGVPVPPTGGREVGSLAPASVEQGSAVPRGRCAAEHPPCGRGALTAPGGEVPEYPECPPLTARAYGRWFTDLAVWMPMVRHVARVHDLPEPGALSVGTPGSHPVFTAAAGYVVKFYAPHWPHNVAAEARAYAALEYGRDLPVPKRWAEGALYRDGERWPWPYLVTTRIPGRSVGELREALGREDLSSVARELAPVLRGLHHLPLPCDAPDTAWQERLARLRGEAVGHRQREGGWPESVLSGLPRYLEEAWRLPAPLRLVHADVTEDHALLVPGGGGGWRLSGLIDFADSFIGDPAYDLVALYLSLLHCDAQALGAFLQAYGPEAAWAEGWRRRATACLLMFPFDVWGELVKHWPEVSQVRVPEDLERALWGLGR